MWSNMLLTLSNILNKTCNKSFKRFFKLNVRGGSMYNCASPLRCSTWLDQILLSLRNHVRSTDDLSKRWKSNRWKSRVEVTCKSRSVYEERLKSVELSRAWSFYLSSSRSLLGAIRPLSHCVPQPPTSTSNSTSTSASIPNGLLALSLASSWCIRTILMYLYHSDTPHNSRRAPAEVSASD